MVSSIACLEIFLRAYPETRHYALHVIQMHLCQTCAMACRPPRRGTSITTPDLPGWVWRCSQAHKPEYIA